MTNDDYSVRELMDRALDGLTLPTEDVTEVILARAARKRRQRRGGALLGITATVATVAGIAVAVPNPAGTPHSGPTVSAAALGSASAAATTKSTAAPKSGTAWMPDYMKQTLKSLLPAGSSTAAWSQYGGVPLTAIAPDVTAKGDQYARLDTDLTTPGGRSTTGLSVRSHVEKTHCVSHAAAPHDVCSQTSLNGGTLTVDQSFKNPTTGAGAAIWEVTWNGPEGQTVSFGESTDQPHQALTVAQATALVTSPAWDRLWKSLPAACKFGAMADPHAPAPVGGGIGLSCATSRAVAIHLPSQPTAAAG